MLGGAALQLPHWSWGIEIAKAIFFCSVLYGPKSPAMSPLFWFLVAVLCLFGVWFVLLFLVWSSFLFHCMTTAYRTVYWSFISTTFAAHHQQDWAI